MKRIFLCFVIVMLIFIAMSIYVIVTVANNFYDVVPDTIIIILATISGLFYSYILIRGCLDFRKKNV